MIVTSENLGSVLQRLERDGEKAIDTETTGLRWHKNDALFSLVVTDEEGSLYFNFKEYPDAGALPREVMAELQARVFSRPGIYWYLANAKFDLHMLKSEGLTLAGTVHDVLSFERLAYNKWPVYSLAFVAGRYGFEKSKEVDKYITKHKLYTVVKQEGKKKASKNLHFDRVPFPIISAYALKDGEITLGAGQSQRRKLSKFYGSFGPAVRDGVLKLAQNERTLTKVCFEMERTGIKIDRVYCERAFAETSARARAAALEFEKLTSRPLVDSRAELAPVFRSAGVQPGRTKPTKSFPEGQESYNKSALAASGHPVADALLEYRRNSKVAGTYFRNFLDLADADDRIHGDIRQGGTDTARFSMSEPNLQNLKKNDEIETDSDTDEELSVEESFQVRRAFVPTPGFLFLMVDYDQQEYRMALDYAGQLDLIQKVKAGLDVHQATADLMGVSRFNAKTLNFMLLYGGGVAKLAAALGISLEAARALKDRYFQALPDVVGFIRQTISEAERRGFIFNWAERKYHFDRDSSYKAPNTKIQGGGADVMRFAMVRIDELLRGRKTRQIVTVHDELLFELHESELALAGDIVGVMEGIFPSKHLTLTCSASHSRESWADKIKGVPT